MLEVGFDRARGMFRPCSSYVSTVLELSFDRARDVLQPCLRYLSAVARGMFRPSREVCFEHARVMFAAMPEKCFYRPQSMFRPSSRNVSTDLRYVTHGMCLPCSRYASIVHEVWFDRRSRYVSTVARGMFRPSRKV